jgi:branched-chain amino acid transport system ATP-binding protein
MRSHMLSVRGLVVGYGSVTALNGIDVSVDRGELVCMIGPNGAGKTTLMKTIAGLLRPRAGEIEFDQHLVASRSMSRSADVRVRAGIALVPEGRHVFAPLTVRDNLAIGAYVRLARGDDTAVAADLQRIYEMFPRLKERADQMAGTLSGGEQQMLAIGRALMARPRLLVLDEPSMGLAPLVVAEIFAVIRRLHAEGTTVLIAEQNARMALSVAERGYVIESGLVVKSDTATALARDPVVWQAYLGGA